MKLSCSNIENFLIFFQKEAFIIFKETKKILIFQETELSYISGNGTP